MNIAGKTNDGVIFESVIFREDLVEVSFTEEHDRGEGIALIKTVLVDAKRKVPTETDQLLLALQMFVDAARVALRSPPDEVPA